MADCPVATGERRKLRERETCSTELHERETRELVKGKKERELLYI